MHLQNICFKLVHKQLNYTFIEFCWLLGLKLYHFISVCFFTHNWKNDRWTKTRMSIIYIGMSRHTKILTKGHGWPSMKCSRLVILRLPVQTWNRQFKYTRTQLCPWARQITFVPGFSSGDANVESILEDTKDKNIAVKWQIN